MNDERKQRVKYYLLPFIIQFGVLFVCIPLHRIFIHIGPVLGNPEMVGMEMSDPKLGRLVFAVISFIAFALLTCFASQRSEEKNGLVSFILGAFAGTFLWQSIGEDLWHFSVNGMHFVFLESITVLPLVLLFIPALVFLWKSASIDWGVWCSMLTFGVNWLGHFVLIGIYPLFSGLCEINLWCRIVGISLGVLLMAVSFITGLGKGKNPKERMLSAILS